MTPPVPPTPPGVESPQPPPAPPPPVHPLAQLFDTLFSGRAPFPPTGPAAPPGPPPPGCGGRRAGRGAGPGRHAGRGGSHHYHHHHGHPFGAPPSPFNHGPQRVADGITLSPLSFQGDSISALVDIYDTPRALVVVADLAGASLQGVEVDYDSGSRQLAISGALKQRSSDYMVYSERARLIVERTITLSAEYPAIDEEKIEANLKNGSLTVRVPKIETSSTRKKVVVKSEGSDLDTDEETDLHEKSQEEFEAMQEARESREHLNEKIEEDDASTITAHTVDEEMTDDGDSVWVRN